MPWTAGAVLTAAQLNTYAPQAWSAYTPTWTALTTNPTLGNGTISGEWIQFGGAGGTVHFNIMLTFGSTTTAGSGIYLFSLPTAAKRVMPFPVGNGVILDVSTGVPAYYTTRLGTSSLNVALASDAGVSASNGTIAFATGDRIEMSGTYEAA